MIWKTPALSGLQLKIDSVPERLYWTDSFMPGFEARIADVRQSPQGSDGALWQIALDRTAFYPAGGGQPCDFGSFTTISPGGETQSVPVIAVDEDESGEIWHTTPQRLAVGTRLRCEIDFARRLDHMQQHSGQHLLSAIFLRSMNAATVGFHLGDDESTIDLNIEHATSDEMAGVEKEVNLLIAQDRLVTTRFVPHAEAEALLAAGRLHKLPPRQGDIRLVEIEGADLNACGGTHVRSTGQIGGVLVRGTERVRKNLRVTFVCGLRAVRAARTDFARLQRAASLLAVSSTQVGEAVERLVTEQKFALNQRRKLREHLVDLEAAALIAENGRAAEGGVIRRTFPDWDGEYLKFLALKIAASAPNTCVLLATTASEPAKIVVSRGSHIAINCGAIVKQRTAMFGGRGGGSAAAAQGEIPGARLREFLDAVESSLRQTPSALPGMADAPPAKLK